MTLLMVIEKRNPKEKERSTIVVGFCLCPELRFVKDCWQEMDATSRDLNEMAHIVGDPCPATAEQFAATGCLGKHHSPNCTTEKRLLCSCLKGREPMQ